MSDIRQARKDLLTRILEGRGDAPPTHVPDQLYARTLEHFTEAELVGPTIAVVAING